MCPGETGLFECTVTGLSYTLWVLSDRVTIEFMSNHEIGSGPVYDRDTPSVAFLTRSTASGDRTSILRYVPRIALVKDVGVTCTGGGNTFCDVDTVVIGT